MKADQIIVKFTKDNSIEMDLIAITTVTTPKEVVAASLRTTSVAATAIVAVRFIEILFFLTHFFQFILGSSATTTAIITIAKDGIIVVI